MNENETSALIDAARSIATSDADGIEATRDSARRFLTWMFDNYGTGDEKPSADDQPEPDQPEDKY